MSKVDLADNMKVCPILLNDFSFILKEKVITLNTKYCM